MAKTSLKVKQQRKPKFSTRAYTRCKICGRPHSVLKKYGICRICFRELAYKGEIPGVKKASWSATLKSLKHKSNVKTTICQVAKNAKLAEEEQQNDNDRSNCGYADQNPECKHRRTSDSTDPGF